MPRFEDGSINLQELLRWLAESVANEIMSAEVDELWGRPLGGLLMPHLWLDATYVRCRGEGRVASIAVVTAIGCDSEGWRHVLGVGVVDTESHDSWLVFLSRARSRGVCLVVSDAHEGLRRAVEEELQGAAWQRCAVRFMRGRAQAASGLRRLSGASRGSWRPCSD